MHLRQSIFRIKGVIVSRIIFTSILLQQSSIYRTLDLTFGVFFLLRVVFIFLYSTRLWSSPIG